MATRSRSQRAARRAVAEDGTQARILDAALAVFAERGFDGSRTRDIAERAGANLGLLTYYFGDKEALWRTAVTRAFEQLRAELADALAPRPDDDGRSALAELVRRFIRFVARNPEFMRLMNDEGKRGGPRMRWLADRHVKPLAAALRRLVEGAQARGVLPPVSPVSLHYIALGAAGLVFSQAPECARVHGVDPTREDFAEAHADALVALLLGSGKRSPPGRPRR
jgi:AcrR family transcriptional regulator